MLPTKQTEQAGKQLYVEVTGSGKDVLLLHGWGMHGGLWYELIPDLAEEYRLHIVDLPGHGFSHEMPIKFDLESVSQALENYVQTIAHPIHIIAWSLGGLLALNLKLRNNIQIEKLVLVASNPCFIQTAAWSFALTTSVFEQFNQGLQEDYQATLQRFIALQVRGSEKEREVLRWSKQHLFARGEPDVAALTAGLKMLQYSDFTQQLKQIDCPTLLLGGGKDTLVPEQAIHETARRLPQAYAVVVSKAGHAPFLSHPQQSLQVIKGFLHAKTA